MNGPHDLGGLHGFGPVVPEDAAHRFHAEWEKRVLGLTLASAALGYWNIDASRHARESLPPSVYLGSSYYEIWLSALENLLEQSGEVTAEELSSRRPQRLGRRRERVLRPTDVPDVLDSGAPTDRSGPVPAFSVGDQVRTLNHQPATHTRLPGYARARKGRITAVHGSHVFPDTNAHFLGEQACPLYTVSFSAIELFGKDADPTLSVSIDAWEPYLEGA